VSARSGAARFVDRSVLRGLVVPGLLLALWFFLTQFKLVNPLLLVRPDKVVTSAITNYQEGAIVTPLLASLQRDLLGLFIGSFLGLVIGAAMGVSRVTDRLLGPTFHAAKQVALFAWSSRRSCSSRSPRSIRLCSTRTRA
jgi:sulfonate transport system permease protein